MVHTVLEDFIKSNSLKARVLNGIPRGNAIVCRLFSCSNNFFLTVSLRAGRLSAQKLSDAVSCAPKEVLGQEVEDITGYKEGFLPPVSIYGVTVLLDSAVLERKVVRCLVGADRFIELPSCEIKDFNDDCIAVDITE